MWKKLHNAWKKSQIINLLYISWAFLDWQILATKRYVELTSYPAEDFRFASVIFNKILFLEWIIPSVPGRGNFKNFKGYIKSIAKLIIIW